MGESPGENSHCVLTLVERKSGYLLIGKLEARIAAEINRALLRLLARHPGRADAHDHSRQRDRVPLVWPSRSVKSGQVLLRHPRITALERGTNENTNGLIRQYLSKGQTMARITQSECDLIAEHLNNRPRKAMAIKHLINASFTT